MIFSIHSIEFTCKTWFARNIYRYKLDHIQTAILQVEHRGNYIKQVLYYIILYLYTSQPRFNNSERKKHVMAMSNIFNVGSNIIPIHGIKNKKGSKIISKIHVGMILVMFFNGWWFQPVWKILNQIRSFSQIGMKIKNFWNHHLVYQMPLNYRSVSVDPSPGSDFCSAPCSARGGSEGKVDKVACSASFTRHPTRTKVNRACMTWNCDRAPK